MTEVTTPRREKDKEEHYATILTRGGTVNDNLLLFVFEVDICRCFFKRLAAHARAPPCKKRTSLSPANGPNA